MKRARSGSDEDSGASGAESVEIGDDWLCILPDPLTGEDGEEPEFVTAEEVALRHREGRRWVVDRLLRGIDMPSFVENHFGKRPLHLAEGGDRVAHLARQMRNLDVEALLRDTSSDSVFVWVSQGDHLASIEMLDPGAAAALHEAGHSTYCRAPPDIEQPLVACCLSTFMSGLRMANVTGGGAKGEVEMFCSRAGHLTGWHFDFQHNFTIQLSGRKRWSLRRSSVATPTRACTPHYTDRGIVEVQINAAKAQDGAFVWGAPPEPRADDDAVIEVGPGDVLYHPPGWWHSVEAVEDSISINVSLIIPTMADVVAEQVRQVLLRTPEGRGHLTVGSSMRDALRDTAKRLEGIVRAGELEWLASEAALSGVIGGTGRPGEFDVPAPLVVDARSRPPPAGALINRRLRLNAFGASVIAGEDAGASGEEDPLGLGAAGIDERMGGAHEAPLRFIVHISPLANDHVSTNRVVFCARDTPNTRSLLRGLRQELARPPAAGGGAWHPVFDDEGPDGDVARLLGHLAFYGVLRDASA